jgi:hypothetical protein
MTTIVKFLRPLGLAAATVAAGSFILQSAPARAAELVTNGNFSNGGTGWDVVGAVSIIPVSTLTTGSTPAIIALTSGFGNVAAIGNVPAAGATPVTASGRWSQTLATNPGSTYDLSFNFANYSALTGINSPDTQSFRVLFNGTALPGLGLTLTGQQLTTSLSPTRTTFVGSGSGNDTLSFLFNNVTASAIDNVSVIGDPRGTTGTPAPEPFTIIGTLIGGSAAIRMRRKLNLNK